eukprot:1642960-Amphidinium_carterae.1
MATKDLPAPAARANGISCRGSLSRTVSDCLGVVRFDLKWTWTNCGSPILMCAACAKRHTHRETQGCVGNCVKGQTGGHRHVLSKSQLMFAGLGITTCSVAFRLRCGMSQLSTILRSHQETGGCF